MKRAYGYAVGMMMSGLMIVNAMGGEASTSASAGNGWGRGGTAAATANYIGDGVAGLARTRTNTGNVNTAHGLAIGLDRDGLDFSYSHAIAGRYGPAYAGTFNLSIGTQGDVSGSYGGVVARGGAVRNVEAGGTTRSGLNGANATAFARGDTSPGGTVRATTHSYSRPTPQAVRRVVVHRPTVVHRSVRSYR